MRISHGISALALLASISLAPLAAKADLTSDQQAAIVAAVDAAMASGNASQLQTVLSGIAPADVAAAAAVVSNEISTVATSTPTLATNQGVVAQQMVATLVAANPAQSGEVLATTATLSVAAQTVAITQAQTTLTAAAGGNNTAAAEAAALQTFVNNANSNKGGTNTPPPPTTNLASIVSQLEKAVPGTPASPTK